MERWERFGAERICATLPLLGRIPIARVAEISEIKGRCRKGRDPSKPGANSNKDILKIAPSCHYHHPGPVVDRPRILPYVFSIQSPPKRVVLAYGCQSGVFPVGAQLATFAQRALTKLEPRMLLVISDDLRVAQANQRQRTKGSPSFEIF